ncbi:MAG: hypothetical protein ABIF10_02875 [Candidatus Woesearchaeota archaeon]
MDLIKILEPYNQVDADGITSVLRIPNTVRDTVVKYVARNSCYYLKSYQSQRERTAIETLKDLKISCIEAFTESNYLETCVKGPLLLQADISARKTGELLAFAFNEMHQKMMAYGDTIDNHFYITTEGIKVVDFGSVTRTSNDTIKLDLLEVFEFIGKKYDSEKARLEAMRAFQKNYFDKGYFSTAVEHHKKYDNGFFKYL